MNKACLQIQFVCTYIVALFPVFVLQFEFSIIHGSGTAVKNGEGLGTLIT